MPHTAKVFRSGNSQAVRLPKEFRLDTDEVDISREGDAIILRPRNSSAWSSLKAALKRGFSDDFLQAERDQPPMQDRPELDDLFK
ncbi:AbrB/MazE/SpoVT family DNA-binding domain-containing protein [Phyllobacterium sp. YR531]|uniref:AbrB/MazE/SpoVT family DNA-binding domain-containing protein n=1 Tax=Phyllobacterium sp. YR531 TaxID=1144343 RepID=UPI00026F87B6|nr:AbrB/MazE/SpoVT family DNA-binding domain-containing protein [Phyllobacterium sp. YR531]EJM98433.1 virulence-associated protein [Phyllobacterium sp. YR531]